jgi:hypothetical protein
MQIRKAGRLVSALMTVPVLGISLAACGTTVDPASGEKLIRDFAKQNQAAVKSVSCPSGVKPKDGSTFDCKVDLTENSTGKDHKGTITVHITAGGKKVEITGSQDIHLS